jgi:polysaccharide chain length determinant protein (PEP-CTERM system associated)
MLPGKNYSALDVALMVRRRLWLIVVPFIVTVFAALIVSSKLHNVYRSEMLIQIVPQQVPESYVQSTVTMRTEDRLNALRQQVLSRTELERLIQTNDLYTTERATLPMQDVVERMRADTLVDPVVSTKDGRTEAEAFYIRFSYPDAAIATRVTERLGSLFIDQNARDRGTLADTTDEFLQTQLADARKRLEAQEQKVQRFREQHAGRLPSQLQFNQQAIQSAQLQLSALEESLARDRDRKLLLERLYNDAAQSEPSAVPIVTSNTNLEPPAAISAQQQLALLRGNLTRLEMRYKPEHPDVIRAKRQIADLEQKVAAESAQGGRQSVPPPLTPAEATRLERLQQQRADIESVDRQIAFRESEAEKLKKILADYQNRIEAVPGIESEWISLTRDYDAQQSAYRDLLSKSAQAKVAANLERRQVGEQFKILDPPRVPERPVRPNRMRITMAAAGGGLLLGLLLAALVEFRDSTFKTEADILQVLELPVVALVPAITSEADRVRQRNRRIWASTAASVAVLMGSYVCWAMRLWRFVR